MHGDSNRVTPPPNSLPANPPSPSQEVHEIPCAEVDTMSMPSCPPLPSAPLPVPPQRFPTKIFHPYLTGSPCDSEGNFLEPGTPPPPRHEPQNPWAPYDNELQFEAADFLYRHVEMSAGNVDHLLDLWAQSLEKSGELGPFASHEQMYATIDATVHGDVPWKCFVTGWGGEVSASDPTWKSTEYEVWYRDPNVVAKQMLQNPDFEGLMDYAAYVDLDKSGQQVWNNFMSGNYSWRHSTKIYEDNTANKGAMYCPIILGSDKTTVSVATGHVEYHPLYFSIGNLHNSVRRAHRNAIIPIGFLAIPKVRGRYTHKNKKGGSGVERIVSSVAMDKKGFAPP